MSATDLTTYARFQVRQHFKLFRVEIVLQFDQKSAIDPNANSNRGVIVLTWTGPESLTR